MAPNVGTWNSFEMEDKTMAEPKLLKIKEVAAILGSSESWIWKTLKRDNSFPQPLRSGLRWTRWRASDVYAWLNRRDASASAEGVK